MILLRLDALDLVKGLSTLLALLLNFLPSDPETLAVIDTLAANVPERILKLKANKH